ncbi:MAG TPA: hypothetical protein VGE76_21190, partial [Opitutaceae bacterium]
MQLDFKLTSKTLRQMKTEPHGMLSTRRLRGEPREGLVHPLAIFRREAWAGVDDAHVDAIRSARRRDLDHTAWRR